MGYRWKTLDGGIDHVSWFPDWKYYEDAKATLSSVSEDPAGRLWVILMVPNGKTIDTRNEFGPAKTQDYDLLVEVLDVKYGLLLASQRFGREMLNVLTFHLQDGSFAGKLEDDDDHSRVRISRLLLVPRTKASTKSGTR
jgi:hypothetical protein